MKKSILFLSALLFIVFLSSTSFSQDEEMMKKWQEYMTPGDMHKMLAKGTGTWKAKSTFWMTPGAEPTVSDATATGEMILGGRYLMSKYSGNMWGMPFEGIAVEGYDNAAKLFMTTWIDNMGTGIMYMTGKWDDAAKQVNYTGKMFDFMTNNWIELRQVVSHNSDGSTKMEMFCPAPDGKEYKNMEVIFTK